MRKGIIAALFAAALSVVACYNDDDLQKKVNDLDKRVTTLEEQVKELNEKTIPGLQATVAAIKDGVMVSKVTNEKGGCTILFSDGTSAFIRDGKDGDKGERGPEPVLAITEKDGEFYWTLDGKIVKDPEGNDLPVYQVLPQFRVNNGKWEVSYDAGQTWAVVTTMGATENPISIVDGEDTVTFYIGEEKYEISKEVPFYLVIEKRSDIAVIANTSTSIPYSVAGVKEGDEVEVDVLSIIGNWEASVVAESPEKGSIEVKSNGGDAKIFVYAANGRGRTDIKSISFENGQLSAVLAAQTVDAEGGEVALDITTNTDYILDVDPKIDWINVAATKAMRVDNYMVTVDANKSADQRSATIYVKTVNGKSVIETIEVVQEGGESSISDLASIEEGVKVKVPALVVVAETKSSALLSDGTAYVYAEGIEVSAGDVVTVTGKVATDDTGNSYLTEATAEESAEAVTAPEAVITYYGIDEPHSLVGMSGTLALNNGIYSIKTPYGATARIVDPIQDIDALVGKNVAVGGYFGKINLTGDLEVYYLVATSVKDATYKEADWTVTYSYDSAEEYPEIFDVETGSENVTWAAGIYTQEDFEYYYPDFEFNDVNLVIGSADDAKYTCWFYGYLLDMSFSEVLDMLSHKGSDIDSYSEFDLGTYYYIVYSIDEFGNATGEYKVTKIVKEMPEEVEISIEMTEISHNSAVASFTPNTSAVYYLPAIESPEWVEQFSSYEELAQADIDYWKSKYGNSYAQYNYKSIEDLILNGLCSKGADEVEAPDLEPESKYYAYAFALDENLNIISDVFVKSFTTEAAPDYKFYGTANWHDSFVSTFFDMGTSNLDLDCDVYVDESKPGVFYFDSPYWYDNIAEWFDDTPEGMKPYTGNYRAAMIEIDCTNPEEVKMPIQDLGVSLSSTYGWISGGYSGGYVNDSFGTYADNTITFDANGSRDVLLALSNYASGAVRAYEPDEDFVVTITPGGSPVKPASVSAASARVKKSGKNAIAASAKVSAKYSISAEKKASKKSTKTMNLHPVQGRSELKK